MSMLARAGEGTERSWRRLSRRGHARSERRWTSHTGTSASWRGGPAHRRIGAGGHRSRERRTAHGAGKVLYDRDVAITNAFAPLERDGHLANARLEHRLESRINERHRQPLDAGHPSRSFFQRGGQTGDARVTGELLRVNRDLTDGTEG